MEEIPDWSTGSWNDGSARYWELVRFEISDLLHFAVEALADDVPDPRRGVWSPFLRYFLIDPSDQSRRFNRFLDPTSI